MSTPYRNLAEVFDAVSAAHARFGQPKLAAAAKRRANAERRAAEKLAPASGNCVAKDRDPANTAPQSSRQEKR